MISLFVGVNAASTTRIAAGDTASVLTRRHLLTIRKCQLLHLPP